MTVTTWTLTGDVSDLAGEDWPTTGATKAEAYLTAYDADGPCKFYVDTATGGKVRFGPTIPLTLASDGTFTRAGIPDSSETGLSYALTLAYRPTGHGRSVATTTDRFTLDADKALNQVGFVNPDFSAEVILAQAVDAVVAPIVSDESSLTNIAIESEIAEALVDYASRAAVQYVDAHGGDPTGVADSTGAFNAALAALPTDAASGYPRGRVVFGVGTYRIGTSVETANIGPKVIVTGQGWGGTVIDYRGSGRAFRAFHSWFVHGTYAVPDENALMGGGVIDLTVDGTNSGAGAVGVRYGDGIGQRFEVEVRHFNQTGSVGMMQVNTVTWTEKVHNASFIWDCTTHFKIDVDYADDTTTIVSGATLPSSTLTIAAWKDSFPRAWGGVGQTAAQIYVAGQVVTFTGYTVNGDGTATLTGCSGGTGTLSPGDTVRFGTAGVSHGYNDVQLRLGAQPNQGLVRIAGGSNFYGGSLVMRGNMPLSGSSQPNAISLWVGGNPPAGTRLAGSNPAAQILYTRLDVQMECYGSGGNAPKTLQVDGGSYIRNTYGIARWGGGSWVTAGLNAGTGMRFNHLGFVVGDSTLNPDTSTDGTGGPRMRGPVSYSEGNGNATGPTVDLAVGDMVTLTLTAASTGTLSLNNPKVGPQRKTVIVKQQSTGGVYNRTLTWPTNAAPTTSSPTVKWPGGTPPTMSTGAGATDVYTLVTLDGATWYGVANQAMS